MTSKTYPKYKDIPLEWLSLIPEHWNIKKIGYTTYVKGRIGWQGLKSDEFIDEGPYLVTGTDFINGIVNWESCYHVAEERYDEDPYIHLKEGDLLITKDGTIGKVAIVKGLNDKATLNSGIFLTRPRNDAYSTRYMYWVLNSKVFEAFIESTKTGTTIAHLYQNVFVRFTFPEPTASEQNQIADFLDEETNRIDALIEQKQEFIRLLNEKRTSLIYHAVTKGLNPKVKLKHSDISWLGDVPEHWEVKKLKYISKGVQTGITPPSDKEEYFEEEINWFTPGDFSNNLFLNDSKRKLSKLAFEDGVARFFPAYSVLLVGIGATLGKVGYIDKPASSNQQINAIFFDCIEKAKYYSYYLLINQPNVVSYANASTLAILNQTQTKDIPVIIPNFEELKQIVNYLDTETVKLDYLASEVEKAIEKLYEYRTALITAAVTGKINVSNQ